MKTIKELREAIETTKARSAWSKGVKVYALELIEEMDDYKEFYASPANMKELLNGADNWHEYSYGGAALIYDRAIAERLCTPSELKVTKNGQRRPNAREEWLDTQERALRQAAYLIKKRAQ
jgi:hypothetical protein